MARKKRTGLSTSTLDKLWAKKVKELAGNRCEICGSEEGLNSHHIQPKNIYAVRWYITNGCCLCNEHHQKGVYSAHKNPLWFMEHLARHRGEMWFMDLIHKTATEIDWKSKLSEIKESLL